MMYIQAEYNQICYENVNACAVIGSKPCTPTLYIETKPTPSPTPSHYTRSYPASEKQKGKLSQTRNHAIILINNLYENVRDNLWFLEIQHIFCTVITDCCTVITDLCTVITDCFTVITYLCTVITYLCTVITVLHYCLELTALELANRS